MSTKQPTPVLSNSCAQAPAPGIPVHEHHRKLEPHLESFPQPAISTQEALQRRLQQHPYQSGNSRQQQPAQDLLSQGTTSDMASVPKHLNFITGNKNKLAEVRIRKLPVLLPAICPRVRYAPKTLAQLKNMREHGCVRFEALLHADVCSGAPLITPCVQGCIGAGCMFRDKGLPA